MSRAKHGYSPTADAVLIKRIMRVRAMLIAEGHACGHNQVTKILSARFGLSIVTIQRIVTLGEQSNGS